MSIGNSYGDEECTLWMKLIWIEINIWRGRKGEVSYLHHTENECNVLSFSYKYCALFAYVKFNVCRSIMLVFLTINPRAYTCKLLAGYSWNFILEVRTKIVGSFLFSWRIHVTALYFHDGVTESQEHCKYWGVKNACGKCILVHIALHVCCRMGVNKNYITWRQIYYHYNSHVWYTTILQILS